MSPDVIKVTLSFILPSFLAIGVGLASKLIGSKKENKDSEINKESYKKLIKELLDEICSECSFRNIAVKVEITEKRMSIAIRALNKLKAKMKTDFLHYCVKKEICEKAEVLSLNTFFLFANTFNSAKASILDELRNQFLRNGIETLNSFEIENRSNLLWNIITESFDKYYKTNERPGRVELYDFSEDKKDKYVIILNSIYEQSKNIKF